MRTLHSSLTGFEHAALSPVSLVLEIGGHQVSAPSVLSSNDGSPWPKVPKLGKPACEVRKKGNVYEIHSKQLSAIDVNPDDSRAESAFKAVLESAVDPRKTGNIPSQFREIVVSMFPTQPYMENPPVPVYRSKLLVKK
jgi:hypothetical protein